MAIEFGLEGDAGWRAVFDFCGWLRRCQTGFDVPGPS